MSIWKFCDRIDLFADWVCCIMVIRKPCEEKLCIFGAQLIWLKEAYTLSTFDLLFLLLTFQVSINYFPHFSTKYRQNEHILTLTLINFSRISLLKIFGFNFFRSSIRDSISGVATFGFEPPITPGLIDPVSWYRFRIFETQPWDTRSCRDITHGRMPAAAISTIFSRVWFGSGRPLMKTPPSWLTRPWPVK